MLNSCWCSHLILEPYSPDYQRCKACETLISNHALADVQGQVINDETDFYGKNYYLNSAELPDIYTRARMDLTERNLHWLKTLLKYQLPPAKVLEIGCSHAAFVALLRQVGFDASGFDLSPWVVEFASKAFDVPVAVGPLEQLDFPAQHFDVIVLMDVFEHVPVPKDFIAQCIKLLKPNGFLLIQTPEFNAEQSYAELIKTQSRFLEMMRPEEHLYLFSRKAVTQFFSQLGLSHIYFEQAIFDAYDMFFIVSQVPLSMFSWDQIQAVLLSTPQGRFVLAMLDLRERELTLTKLLQESERDRAERLPNFRRMAAAVKRRIASYISTKVD